MSFIADGFASWRECREEYELTLYAQYVRAEAATNACLLNERGRARGIDPVRAHAYASEELIEHWATDPRITFAAFERQWQHSRAAEFAEAWR